MKNIKILLLIIFFSINKNAFCNNLFESEFIKIEAKTKNVFETKAESIEEIKIKSLIIILNKILNEKDKIKFTEFLNNSNLLNQLVQNIIIENEIITNQKYIAEIKVNFDKRKIISFLRNQKINYSDFIPKPFLIISSYNQDFINIGLEKNNYLINQLKNNINSQNNYLLNYYFPNLDPNDRYILSYEKILTEDKNSYKKIMEKYKAEHGFYINIKKNYFHNIFISIKLFDKNSNSFKEIIKIEHIVEENLKEEDIFVSISEIILHKLDNWWRNKNQIDNSLVNSIKCTIKSNNFDDFISIKSKINKLSQLITVKPIKIALNNNIETINYYGDINMLTKSIHNYGLILINSENCIISSNL